MVKRASIDYLNMRKSFQIALSLLAMALAGGPADAQLGPLIGVLGGSVLLDKAGDEFENAVSNAKAAAESLIGTANGAAKERLEQIDEIVNRTGSALINQSEDAARRILVDAVKQLGGLEDKAYQDAKDLIWQTECAGKRLTREDARRTLGKAGEWLNLYEFELSPPVKIRKASPWYSGCFAWCEDPYRIKIEDPFDVTYKRVKELMEESISAQAVNDQTPAHDIVQVYSYLSAFARSASCSYPGASLEWIRESARYSEKAKQWQDVLDMQIK